MLIQAALLALAATLGAAVTPLEVQNNFFVTPVTKDRFQIVGVAYQPGGSAGYNPEAKRDPLSDRDHCMRDATLMQILGFNAIRVYNLDPELNHDECASIFNAAGMYMLLDVNSPLPGESLSSAAPWESYYAAYLNRTFAVVESFKNYPNTLAFFSGNEVISDVYTGGTVPKYVRAVTRDLKNYIAKHSTRKIPVGYSAADVRAVLFDSFNYFQCAVDGDVNDMSRADIFALNSYSWCGTATFKTSGYDTLVSGFDGSSVPVFYSEYGCNKPSPRVFTEVPTIYGPDMTGVFSGGIVYEYAEEVSNFGLVNITDDGTAIILKDYYSLMTQYFQLDSAKIQGEKVPAATPPKPPKCDAKLITTSGFETNFTLPELPPGAAEIIQNGVKLSYTPGLVPIKDWNVKFKVMNTDGSTIGNLKVNQLAADQSNQPGTNTFGEGDITPANGTTVGDDGGAATPTPSEDAAAPIHGVGQSWKAAVGVSVGLASLFAVGGMLY